MAASWKQQLGSLAVVALVAGCTRAASEKAPPASGADAAQSGTTLTGAVVSPASTRPDAPGLAQAAANAGEEELLAAIAGSPADTRAVLAPKICPEGMVLVEGEYCPNLEHECLRWLDPPTDRYAYFRCAEYKRKAICRGKKVHKRFCIDKVERTEPGSDLPKNHVTWTQAKQACEAAGARLCLTSEWNFACEGEEMRPYPYGWERDATACNIDIMTGLGKVGSLVDHRTPASAHPRCVSPFGVHDMSGNVQEWTTLDGAGPGQRELLKGSWWIPGQNACRSTQPGHGASYGGTETGYRCCKDAAR
jgi:hypothetical protein